MIRLHELHDTQAACSPGTVILSGKGSWHEPRANKNPPLFSPPPLSPIPWHNSEEQVSRTGNPSSLNSVQHQEPLAWVPRRLHELLYTGHVTKHQTQPGGRVGWPGRSAYHDHPQKMKIVRNKQTSPKKQQKNNLLPFKQSQRSTSGTMICV